MRLLIKGSVHERANFSTFESVVDDLPSILGKKQTQAVSDTFFLVKEIKEDSIVFDYITPEKAEEIVLHCGESHHIQFEGNAYGFTIDYALVG